MKFDLDPHGGIILPENDLHTRYIWERIREGLWPFKPHRVSLHMEYDIDYNKYRVFAVVKFKSGYPFEHVETVGRDALVDDIYAECYKIGQGMFEAFRYRELREVVPDNIILGED